MHNVDNLLNIGLSKAEINVYLAAVEAGPALYTEVAEKAGVKRPTLYYHVVPSLLEKGLLVEVIKGKRKYLMAQDLQLFLDDRKSELKEIEQLVPQLRTIMASTSSKPQVLVYEGIEGIKKVWTDHLVQRQPILEIVGIEKIHPALQKYIKQYYIIERCKRRIPLQMLISGPTIAGIFKVKTDPYELREVKTIDGSLFPIPLGCDIYGDNVSFTLHREESEPIGVIIRSKEIAVAMRSLFLFVWAGAE